MEPWIDILLAPFFEVEYKSEKSMHCHYFDRFGISRTTGELRGHYRCRTKVGHPELSLVFRRNEFICTI